MILMTISDARASLAEVVDQVRVTSEPVYLTRRDKPVAALVDIAYLDALRRASMDTSPADDKGEYERRLAAIETGAAPFTAWAKPGVKHPSSASNLYASRTAS